MSRAPFRRVVPTDAGQVTIGIFPAQNHASVTLYDPDGWELRGEDTDYSEKDIRQSLVILGVPEARAAEIAAQTVARYDAVDA